MFSKYITYLAYNCHMYQWTSVKFTTGFCRQSEKTHNLVLIRSRNWAWLNVKDQKWFCGFAQIIVGNSKKKIRPKMGGFERKHMMVEKKLRYLKRIKNQTKVFWKHTFTVSRLEVAKKKFEDQLIRVALFFHNIWS